METINIELPEPFQAYIQERVAKGDFTSVSEYIIKLVQEDRKRQALDRIEVVVTEAYASGPGLVLTEDNWDTYWEERERRLVEGHNARTNKAANT